MHMREEIDIEDRQWNHAGIEYVLQFIQPRRECFWDDNTYADAYICEDPWTPCSFTTFADLDWNDATLDLEEEFRDRTAKSDATSLTALTGALDIAEPGLKIATMTHRQRKNFNRGAQAVSSNSDVIASCLDQNLIGPVGLVDRPPGEAYAIYRK